MDNLDFDIVESLKEVEQRCNTFLNAVNDCGSNVLVGSSSCTSEFQLPFWVLSMDLRKAFDTINHRSLFDGLKQHGIPEACIHFVILF